MMIEIESLPLKEDPLRHLLRLMKQEGSRPFETALVLPTARSIRHILRLMGRESSTPAAAPYCFEMKELTDRMLDSGGLGLVPEELRIPYLQKAVRRLDRDRLKRLFGEEHGRYHEDFIRFASVGRRLLRFYEELFADGVGFEELRTNSLYTDYEQDVTILAEIASLYREMLKEAGLTDLMFLKRDFLAPGGGTLPQDATALLRRFKRFYCLVSGRLSMFELRLLKEVSASVDLKVLLPFEGVPDGEIGKIHRVLRPEAPLPSPIPPAPYPSMVEIVELSLPEEQAGFVLESFRKSIEMGIRPEETVVVLPDEGLKRILHTFDRGGIFNFAMGLDLKDSVFYSFLKILETMLSTSPDGDAYDAGAVLSFLSHPFVRGLAGRDYPLLLRDVKKRNRLFITREELCASGETGEVCRRIWDLTGRESGFGEFCGRVREFTAWLLEKNSTLAGRLGESPEFVAAREAFFEGLIALSMLPYGNIWTAAPGLRHLAYLNDCIGRLAFPHTWGGPLTVMGMLETRALSFQAVIIPDMNEEFMPPASEKEMFLNTEIRRLVGLPTFLDREALSRTYFNGLLKKAKAVFLSYTASEGRRPRSRFIEEILLERGREVEAPEPARGPGIRVSSGMKSPAPAKDSHVLRAIETMELTPTSLRTYRECKFRFYLKYIKGLREKEELTGRLRRVDVGNIFHDAVRTLYRRLFGGPGRQPLLFQPPDPCSRPRFWEELTAELQRALFKEAEGYDVFSKSAHAWIELEVFVEKLKSFVESERAVFEAGWRPRYLEFPVAMKFKGLRFRGKIDRVDVMEGTSSPRKAVIIDYKLSEVKSGARTVLDDEFVEFQLPLYRVMLGKTVRDIEVEGLAYYDLKKTFRLKRVFEDLSDEDFLGHIEDLVRELRDPEGTFEHTEKERHCLYCSYRDLCR